jgi:hypothetical protein
MRVLLSTIGSRGDVQPLAARGLQLKALGRGVHLCVPEDGRLKQQGRIGSLQSPFERAGLLTPVECAE